MQVNSIPLKSILTQLSINHNKGIFMPCKILIMIKMNLKWFHVLYYSEVLNVFSFILISVEAL